VTCRHFRRGVAGGLGLCGLDPRRIALRGDEMRACWSAAAIAPDAPARQPQPMTLVVSTGVAASGTGTGGRTFVPVDAAEPLPGPGTTTADTGSPVPAAISAGTSTPGATDTAHRWSLWGELEA
jgi:hypothetical protein